MGVFAKDGGSLTLSGNGAVLFGSSDQIGFYVYGKDSAIHNTGSGVMDVSTENSTLFRIASGATFQELQMLLLHLRRLVRTLMHLLPRGNRMAVWPRQ